MTVREQPEVEEQDRPAAGVVVYGVVRPRVAVDGAAEGVAGAPVDLVAAGKTAALVSDVETLDLRATRRDLLAHSRVLEKALTSSPVLPLRFGIVFRDRESVISELLVPRRAELESLLSRLEGLVELRVKAFYVENEVLRDVVSSDASLGRLAAATRDLPDGVPHPDRLRLGEAVAYAVERERRSDADAILDRLRPLARDVAVEPDPPAGYVMTASFLVDRDRVGAFDGAMDDLARRSARRLRFKYVGPLPPHSFVSFET